MNIMIKNIIIGLVKIPKVDSTAKTQLQDLTIP